MKTSHWMEQVSQLSADPSNYVARVNSPPSLDLALNSLFHISAGFREVF